MTVADDLVQNLHPFMSPAFEDIARSIGTMWNHVELYSAYDGGTAGWLLLFDIDNCPAEALPWLAQVVGERLRGGLTEPQAREWIHDRPNAIRGTPFSIARAAQRSLVGARTVQLYERTNPDGSADANGDNILIYTYAADTPNRAQVWQDILGVLPADMKATYAVLTAVPWSQVKLNYATWNNVKAAFSTWAAVEGSTISGGQTWTH